MVPFNKKDVEKLIVYFDSDKFFNLSRPKEKARLVKEFMDFKRLYEKNELGADAYDLAKRYIDHAGKWMNKNPEYIEAYKKYYEPVMQKVSVR